MTDYTDYTEERHPFNNELPKDKKKALITYYVRYDKSFNIIISNDKAPTLEPSTIGHLSFETDNSWAIIGNIRKEDLITERIPAAKPEELIRYNNDKEYRYFIKYYINDFMETLEEYQQAIEEAYQRGEIIQPKKYIYDYRGKGENKIIQAAPLVFEDLYTINIFNGNETEHYKYITEPSLARYLKPEGFQAFKTIYFNCKTCYTLINKRIAEQEFLGIFEKIAYHISNNPDIKSYKDFVSFYLAKLQDCVNKERKEKEKVLSEIKNICAINGIRFEDLKTQVKAISKHSPQYKELENHKDESETIDKALYLCCYDLHEHEITIMINYAASHNYEAILQNITSDTPAEQIGAAVPDYDLYKYNLDRKLSRLWDSIIPYIIRNESLEIAALELSHNNIVIPTGDPATMLLYALSINFEEASPEAINEYISLTQDINKYERVLNEYISLLNEHETKLKALKKEISLRDETPEDRIRINELEDLINEAREGVKINKGLIALRLQQRKQTSIISFRKVLTAGGSGELVYKKINYSEAFIKTIEETETEILLSTDFYIISYPKFISIVNRNNEDVETEIKYIYDICKNDKNNNYFDDKIQNYIVSLLLGVLNKDQTTKKEIYFSDMEKAQILGISYNTFKNQIKKYNEYFETVLSGFISNIKLKNITFIDRYKNTWIDKPGEFNLFTLSVSNGFNLGIVPAQALEYITQIQRDNKITMVTYAAEKIKELSSQAQATIYYLQAEAKKEKSVSQDHLKDKKIHLVCERSLYEIFLRIKYFSRKYFDRKHYDKIGKQWLNVFKEINTKGTGIIIHNMEYLETELLKYRNDEAFKENKFLQNIYIQFSEDPEQHPAQEKLLKNISIQNKIDKRAQSKLKQLQDQELKGGK